MRPLRPAVSGSLWSWNPHERAVLKLLLVRDCPGLRKPTAAISGQSVCSGCGSDDMSWAREWLFTKVTRPPRLIVTVDGLTLPLAPIVIVAESVAVPPPVVGGV